MARYDRGTNRNLSPRQGNWSNPYGDVRGAPYARAQDGNRPWVGGYRDGYQGGSGGMRTGGAGRGGYGRDISRGYGRDFSPRYGRDFSRGYGRDYWWLGEHELSRQGRLGSYDEAYRRFDEQNHPRYSPVGGTYHGMGGRYMYGGMPRPLREDTWFSDWTRWF